MATHNETTEQKIVMIITGLLVVILFTGCNYIGPSTGSGQNLKAYHVGTDGLEIQFLKGNPEYSYEGEDFGSAMFIKNLGAEDVTSESPGRLSVSYDEYFLTLDKASSEKTIELAGKSIDYPMGDEDYFEFVFTAKNLGILRDSITTKINYNLCYPYKTELSTNVCIDTKIRSQDTSPAVCTLKNIAFSGGQGAPVTITKIVPEMIISGENVMPIFDITIENKGNGYIINDTGTNVCSNENIAQSSSQLNRVSVEATLSTDVKLECTPSEVRLLDGQGVTRCKVPKDDLNKFPKNKRNYNTFLEVALGYAYVDTKVQEIEIKRINEVEISNQQECGFYNEYDDSIGKCVPLCQYCVSHSGDDVCKKNKPEGFTFSANFSCACSKEKCLVLSKDNQCIFGYCPGSTYCCSTDDCASKPENATCGDRYICRDKKCGPATMCDKQYGGQDYSCRQITSCNQTTIKTMLCPGGTNNVCCQLPK